MRKKLTKRNKFHEKIKDISDNFVVDFGLIFYRYFRNNDLFMLLLELFNRKEIYNEIRNLRNSLNINLDESNLLNSNNFVGNMLVIKISLDSFLDK
jgi:hypothetical protein